MSNHPNRAKAFGHYTVRIGALFAALPGDLGLHEESFTLGELTREAAVVAYDKIRAETAYPRQVTLYGPKGNRVREALGAAR